MSSDLMRSTIFYTIKDSGPHCSLCDSDAKVKIDEPILVMTYPLDVSHGLVIPSHQGKEATRLYEDIPGHDFLVSRSRNTGIVFKGDLSKYYLDIDFLWMNSLSVLGKDKDVFVVGSNHVLWHLCLMNALYQCSQSSKQYKKKCTLITPSYIIENRDSPLKFINGEYSIEDPNLSRILILFRI